MKKQIVITIVERDIQTNPPQPEQMSLQIDGLLPIEAVLMLASAASQIASKELPPLIFSIKEAQKINLNMGPMGVIGKA